MKPAIPILQELERLRTITAKKPIKIVFQPSAEEQRDLIIKNASNRMVSAAIKKQSVKCIFNERYNKRADETISLGSSVDSLAGNSMEGGYAETAAPVNDRAQTAPIGKNGELSPKQGALRPSMVSSSVRPKTTATAATEHRHGGLEFAELLKSSVVNDEFHSELSVQIDQQSKDVRKVFDAMCTGLKTGTSAQFSPKSDSVAIDVTGLDPMPVRAITKLEDISSIKRKEGMAIFFDPTTNTGGVEVTLRVQYKKMIDLVNEESVTKEFTFHSDGNYYGMKLVQDTFKTTTDIIAAFGDPMNNSSNNSSSNSSSNSSCNGNSIARQRQCSLPGWERRPPFFIPTSKCTIEVVRDDLFSKRAATAFNVSRLRLFAVCCNHPRNGTRKVIEFFNNFFRNYVANLSIAGGMSALNLASLHGNFEGVTQLLTAGADINARNKEARYHTALHEAVIGGHKEIVKFLLSSGANQLIRDELGFCPLHHACKLGNISIARVLINGPAGKRALLLQDNNDKRPIDLAASNFMKSRVEGAMRKFNVFVQPRVSIMDR